MSTLVTTNLKHGGAAGNNIVLNSDGSTTVSGALTLGTSPLAVPSGSAPSYTCRAWVNFDGTGTVAIRASGNVSSITDNSTGNYTINFTTAMPDGNYVVIASSTTDLAAAADTVTVGVVAANEASAPNLKTTTQVTIGTAVSGGTPATDAAEIYVAIFR